ncbi:hypothetical protein Tcan_11626 [Toxocara canis]|uniref:Uncharacterized protein n=1 Tax=Toxocara canis TaxID=6265 RepID=A0A0B2VPY6_TOXCA|nr:hypothetical protein Tcan_11626 [Toxocara canis]
MVFVVRYGLTVEPYCYKSWYFGSAHPAPMLAAYQFVVRRKCPPESLFTYYDCCGNNNRCCEYVKWPIIVFLVLVIVGLFTGCCCFCIFAIWHPNRKHVTRAQYGDMPIREDGYEIPVGYRAPTLSPESHRPSTVYAVPVKHYRSDERATDLAEISTRSQIGCM